MFDYKIVSIILLEIAIMKPIIQFMIEGYSIWDVIETIVYLKFPGHFRINKFRRHGKEDRFLVCHRTAESFSNLDIPGKSCLEKAGWTRDDALEFENSWNGYRIYRIMKEESIASLLDFGEVLRDKLGPDSVDNVARWLGSFDREDRTHRLMDKVDEVMIRLYEEYPEVFNGVVENPFAN